MSERIVRQHVESKFVEDIQRLTQLVEMLKNEQKSYRNRISALEKVSFDVLLHDRIHSNRKLGMLESY